MDAFDFKEPTKPRNTKELAWNILTILVLVSICCVAGVTASIIINPAGAIQVSTGGKATDAIIPSITPTPRLALPPTWTAGPTDTAEPTETAVPSQTPFPTDKPGASATPLPPGSMSYVPQGEIQLIQDFGGLGCNWLGVGGGVTDLRGNPVAGLFVQLGGNFNGKLFDTKTTMTGIARQYGEGGYEFQIADKPIASNKTLWVQLIDQADLPLSDRIYFQTTDDCTKNLVYISFKQVK
jgi:hypothetical protein